MRTPARIGISRRGLLRILGLASGGLWLATGCGDDVPARRRTTAADPASPLPSPLARALERQLLYLTVEANAFEKFSDDFEKYRGAWKPASHGLPQARFLLSTDFFQNGGDEATPVHYVRYYDPYVSPCYNPFSLGEAQSALSEASC